MFGKRTLGRRTRRKKLGLLLAVGGGVVLLYFLPGWFWFILLGCGLLVTGISMLGCC